MFYPSMRELEREEDDLRTEINKLDEADRKQFFREYNDCVKDPDTYAALNYLLLTGLHHFYLGRYLRGFINLIVMIVGFLLLFNPVTIYVGLAAILGVLIIEIPQLFFSQRIVQLYNNRLTKKMLARYQTSSSPDEPQRIQADL